MCFWWLHVPNLNAKKKKYREYMNMKAVNLLHLKAWAEFVSVQQEKRKRVCERHPGNRSNHSLRVSILHPAQTSYNWQHCLLWLELQAAGLSACCSVNNVNNFPTSSDLTHSVGFVSSCKQEKCCACFLLCSGEEVWCNTGLGTRLTHDFSRSEGLKKKGV